MSIAVRVSVWVLGALVAISVAIAVPALLQNRTLQGQNQNLNSQITSDKASIENFKSDAKKLQDQVDQLNNKINQTNQEKAQIQTQVDDLKHKSDDLQSQLQQANTDRDDWKNRVDTITHERDDLLQKLKDRPTEIVYKDRIVQAPANNQNASAPDVNGPQGDQYWAGILKQKAALQVELEKEKADLDQAALQVVDLKKQNSDLELEIKKVTNEKDEIIQKIKYGQDLADNLSVDLARSRNDQKAVNERAQKLKEENLELLAQIRGLNTNKLQLERTVSRLTDDKDAMQKKLIETESVIQTRIDDIWKIKESLDKKLSDNSAASGMELPPIIVNPNSQQQGAAIANNVSSTVNNTNADGNIKTQGSIISINETNNFVIVDLGQQNSPVSVGNALKVYRSGSVIATLEVIQVRKDICAADIKDKSSALKVGDVVKLN